MKNEEIKLHDNDRVAIFNGVNYMSEKIDEKLIEQLKHGEIFDEEPKETDPTKLNRDNLEKGGGQDD